jgi:hypothetical protein
MYFGVDPGLNGAVSLFDGKGNYHHHIRIPTIVRDGGPIVKRRIDPERLNYWIKHLIDDYDNSIQDVIDHSTAICYLEYPEPIPSNGFVRIASLNHSLGIIEGVFVSMGIKVIYISPKEWKKSYRLTADNKKQAIVMALKFAPQLGSIKVKDLDVAESILIGQ